MLPTADRREKLGAAAEHMIDELIQYLTTHPDINNEITILEEEIQCATHPGQHHEVILYQIQRFSCIRGPPPKGSYESCPKCMAQNKRREPRTPLDFTNDNSFPAH
jgi:hypothetical protein